MILEGIDWLNLDIFSIFKGCGNAVLSKMGLNKERVLSTQSYRMDMICSNCSLNTNGQCDPSKTGEVVVTFTYNNEIRNRGEIRKGCGCSLICKTANMDEKCPLGKWLNVI